MVGVKSLCFEFKLIIGHEEIFSHEGFALYSLLCFSLKTISLLCSAWFLVTIYIYVFSYSQKFKTIAMIFLFLYYSQMNKLARILRVI